MVVLFKLLVGLRTINPTSEYLNTCPLICGKDFAVRQVDFHITCPDNARTYYYFPDNSFHLKVNKEASWLYAELKSHISFLAKSLENSLMRLFKSLIKLNETLRQILNETLRQFLNETLWQFLNETLWQFINETLQQFLNETLQQFLNETLQQFLNETLWQLLNETLWQLLNETFEKSL